MKEVKIRTNRVCAYCEGTLPKGSLCYTYSKKYKGREWVCCECVRQWRNLISVKADRNLIPFDDEGMAYAVEDYVDEVEGEFKSRRGKNKGKVL